MKMTLYVLVMGLVITLLVKCMYGWNPEGVVEDIFEGEQEELADSCEHQVITTPIKCVTSVYSTPATNYVRIGWRGGYSEWVVGGVEIDDPFNLLSDVISTHINSTGISHVGEIGISGGLMTLDFTMCFTNPTGNFHSGPQDIIFFEWGNDLLSIEKRLSLRKDKQGTIYLPDQATQGDLIGFIENHPGWQVLSFKGTVLDSASLEPVWDSVLFPCKADAEILVPGIQISEFYLEQFDYQNITVTF